MLAETAALRLGATVANAAGRLWLGGEQREQERLLPMEELVRVRVPGVRLQREVRQQFEQITNAVFDRLEPFLKHAFERLEEGGRESVINAVSDTFAGADLSDKVLLSVNANPAELMRHIASSVRAPVGLNEAESRLYEILFAECVEYYVRIVRSLPVFEERAAVELLARTATLGAEAARILERLPDRSLLAPDGTDYDTDFRRKYLELVSRDLDEVELYRNTSSQAAAPHVRLSVAYVSLMATSDDGKRRVSTRELPPLRPDMRYWDEAGGEGTGVSVEAALSDSSLVLLRGDAGSGKTTLLRWLAVMAARGAFTGELVNWNGLTPIFIKLREYSGRTPPKPEAMLDGIAGPITGIMPKGWVERELDGGKAILLIDGVDELLDRDRRVVRDWLRKLLAQYDGVRVVITSRPVAAGPDWLRREGFAAIHLERMTPPNMAAFVRQWHQAVRGLGSALPCPVEEIPQYEQSLLASLKDRAHLQSLAGTPLLVAMLCAMHLNRGRQLPRDRMELYRNALHTLVHDRDADRNVPSAADSELSLGDKLVILRDLAWRLSDNHRSEIDLDRAAKYVSSKLRAMRHLDVLDGDQVLEQLRHRSGILRSPSEGRMDFVHRTFQEYLAAEEAAEEDRIGNLIGRAHLDLWRETIIMVAGHANARQRGELLDGILDRAEGEPRYARRLRLLAAACQETLPSVSDELADRLEKAVTELLPARRRTDPPALAAVGTSLLRWLPNSLGQLTQNSAAQTVKTVALIGGEEGLLKLKGYVGDERGEVVTELLEAWNYFDADVYVESVLSKLPLNGRDIHISNSGQLHAARRLRSMSSAHIECSMQGIELLAEFPPLDALWVNSFQSEVDLSALERHSDLERLLLFSEHPVTGASILSSFTKLSWLALPVHGYAHVNFLDTLSHLRFLSISGTSTSTDLSSVSKLAKVGHLHVVGVGEISGLDELGRMSELQHVFIYGKDVRSWLAKLKSVPPSLTGLHLHNCVVPSQRDAFANFGDNVKLTACRTIDGAKAPDVDNDSVE